MDGGMNPPNPKQRYGDMKVPLGLVPAASTVYEALALAEGAEKYGPYNWRETAVEATTYAHAALRHLHLWLDGEDIDPESGKPHLGHAKACLGILADATECGKLIDNRPLPAPTGELLQRWKKSPPPVDAPSPVGDADGYPFTSHRTMAEVMAEESRGSSAARQAGAFGEGDETTACPLDGRNCPPDHDHAKPACHHHRLTARCNICDPKPATAPSHWSDNYVPTPKYEDMRAAAEKKPCDCTVPGRCKIENGWNTAPGTFCCEAEAGE